ncbi:MAG: Gfo/Idh/MocA family oxidoreductase, partial [Lentisphaeria bacterium]|nr:Gfo/Idh/MocA family oxidoreductase [Lentisphaeria bacterium]
MKKIRIGVIGMGSRAYSLILPLMSEQFKERAEITAVYDPEPLKREFAAQTVKSDSLKLFDDREEFLKRGLDLVMVCTPQSGHAENA